MATSENLVEWLRDKVGDNPTDEDGSPVEADRIWTDPELEDCLNDAMISLFKGAKDSFDVLTVLERSWVVKKARAELMLVLAIDSARYAKYTVRDVEAERLSPSSFLEIYETLKGSLSEEMSQAEEGMDLGSTVQEGILIKYDKDYDLMRPTRYLKPGKVPELVFESTATGVKVTIPYVFIADYTGHILKRMSPGAETIIQTYTILSRSEYTDTDAKTEATKYTYRLLVEKSSGEYVYQDFEYVYSYATP